MDAIIISNILSGLMLIAVAIVGYTFKQQLNSQKEKVENMEKISSSMKEYTDIFDMEKLKKYVENERTIMHQDLEILRRKTIKKTTEETTQYFKDSMHKRIDKGTSDMINDLTRFAYWFFTNHMDDGRMEEHIEVMFPNIHKDLSAYFDYYKNGDLDEDEPSQP